MKKLSLLVLLTTMLFATPNPPSDLNFTNRTKNSVTIHWVDNSDDESGFKIYRRKTLNDNSSLDLIYLTKPNETSYKDTFLYADMNYTYEVSATEDSILSDEKKTILRQIVSVFENSKKELQYWYAENINDGRGVTAGIAGFTSETWDLYELIRRYENVKPNNALSKFGNHLEDISLTKDEEDELIYAWANEAKFFKEFRDVQDKMVDELYYYPTLAFMHDLNAEHNEKFRSPLSTLIIYDTYIQHGLYSEVRKDGEHITGLNEINKDTKKKISEDNEPKYFQEFLNIRSKVLKTTTGWKDTTYRVKALQSLLASNNMNLDTTIHLHIDYDNSQDDFYITEKPVENGTWYKPKKGSTWQWQLTGKINTNHDVKLYDIDLFDTSKETIAELKNSGKKVICYFSAGSFEDWRDDKDDFPTSVIGDKLYDWDGENWLDIRSSKVKEIMSKRIKLAKEKGCDGVEPDNVDGYTNESGFDLSAKDQIDFNIFLAQEAHKLGLSIGLKNDLDQIAELEPYFDFALNESCHKYDECSELKIFIDHNKAVLNAEYEVDKKDEYCSNSFGFSMLFLPRELNDSFRYSCN